MTSRSDTPLHSAIRSFEGDENSIKLLLEKNNSGINVRNTGGDTPLLLAVQNKKCSLELIKLLLKHGADVKATSPRDGNTALHKVAMMLNYVENIQLWRMIASALLENGSDANAKNLEGSIPLHLAAEAKFKVSGRVFMLQLEMKSNINARNKNGDTPLHLYMRNDKVHSSDKIIFLEIARDVKLLVNVVNSKGETPLHLAVRSAECDLEMIKKLLKLGADVSMTDATGETTYQAFCRTVIRANLNKDNKRRREDILMSQMLLRGNLEEHIRSSLHVACLFHNVESVRNLLRIGADVNAVDPFGCTPLYYAIRVISLLNEDYDKQCSTLGLMLDYGADVNQQFIPLPSVHNCIDTNKSQNDNIPTFLEAALRGHFVREIPYVVKRRVNSRINSSLDVRDIFAQHATKLLALQEKQIERGIDVQLLNEENRRILMEDASPHVANVAIFQFVPKSGFKDRLSRCSEELQAMSETELGKSGVNFFDLLVASAKDTATYAKNKKLIQEFQVKKRRFPLYQGMLEAQIDRAIEREKLIKSAAVLFSDALKFDDPSDEFYEAALSYCSNQDLLRLIARETDFK